MKNKYDRSDRIIEAIFEVANANPKCRNEVNMWFSKDDAVTAFEVAKRLTQYTYLDIRFNHIKNAADTNRTFNISVEIYPNRPEICP